MIRFYPLFLVKYFPAMLVYLVLCSSACKPRSQPDSRLLFTVEEINLDSVIQARTDPNSMGSLWITFNELAVSQNHDTLEIEVHRFASRGSVLVGDFSGENDTMFVYARQTQNISSTDSVFLRMVFKIQGTNASGYHWYAFKWQNQ